MHYIEYIPGTIARITDKPTRHGHEDVNLLSRLVCRINEKIKDNKFNPKELNLSPWASRTTINVAGFCRECESILLPCSS